MKNNIFKYIFFVFIIIVAIFAISKINQTEKAQENSPKEEKPKEYISQNLNLGIVGFDTINPILSHSRHVQDISSLIYDTLFTINNNYELQENLVSEWAKTSDITYIIKLKENIVWEDGNSLTSEDVKYTIEKIKELGENTIFQSNIKDISEVEIVDNNTIKITLEKEVLFFEHNLIFPIMCKSYYGEDSFKDSEKTKNPIGTGKFKISKIEEKQILLERNQNYWNKEQSPKLDSIKINLYSSAGERYNDFRLGKIDFINTDNVNIEDYIGTMGYNKVESAGREHDFLALNINNKVLLNTEVRKAIFYAIDKVAIVKNVYNGKYIPSDFPLLQVSWLYQGNKQVSRDLEKAKQILQENGWEFKYNYWQKYLNYYTRKLNFNLVVNSSNAERVKVAEIIKEQLEELGIKTNIIKANDKQYNNYKTNKNYDMILSGTYSAANPQLNTYFGENNLANYKNEEVNAIINDLKSITDKELLKQKYKRLYEIYVEDIPYISLYHGYSISAYNKSLSGTIVANPFNPFLNIQNWYKK